MKKLKKINRELGVKTMDHLATITQEVSSIASGTDVFVKSAILDDIRREVKNTKTCNCDDYEVCAYENSN